MTRFLRLINSISVISGLWMNNNERLCAMKPRLRLKRFPPPAGLESETARSAGQRLTYLATGAPAEEIVGKVIVGVLAILVVAEVILVMVIVVVQDCHHPRNI